MKRCSKGNKTLSKCFACPHETQCYSKEERDEFYNTKKDKDDNKEIPFSIS